MTLMVEFNRIIIRPTVVITTVSPNGVSNAAPFSFCSPMASRPKPLFGFCCEVEHDTWRNIQLNKEFVVNLVGEEFGPLMSILEKDFPYEVSEIKECGLSESPSSRVKPPRIAEAYGWMECVMVDYLKMSDRGVWIVGEVLQSDLKQGLLLDVLDVDKAKPLGHIWGDAFVGGMRVMRFGRASS